MFDGIFSYIWLGQILVAVGFNDPKKGYSQKFVSLLKT